MNMQTTPNSVLKSCRTCRSTRLHLFLPLGDHPPANAFLRESDLQRPEAAFPLNAQACLDCGLIQVADQIPAGFFEDYLYIPSGADTMHTHFADLASVLEEGAKGGLIVDIGCNDGLMLSIANRNGSRTLGIDPAANIRELAAEKGVEVELGYFGPEMAHKVVAKHGQASMISTTNTFNHIGDLHDFMEGVKILLEPHGSFVIEVPWAKMIHDKVQFDNIYHEHMSELSLLSIVKLAEAVGMKVVDVTKLSVHGGSMRVFVQNAGTHTKPTPIVAKVLAEEEEAGLTNRAAIDRFAMRVEQNRIDLLELLERLKAEGKTIAGYGAPAKGNTLLNYFGIGTETLDYLVDRNELKQGLYAPGTRIPVVSPDVLDKEPPDYLLVLAWNFFDEIRAQLAAFEANGGRFILPVPTVKILPENQT